MQLVIGYLCNHSLLYAPAWKPERVIISIFIYFFIYTNLKYYVVKLTSAIVGKLEHFNLRYNPVCGKPDILSEFQINGKPDILLSTPPPYAQPPRRTMIDNDLLDYAGDALDDI